MIVPQLKRTFSENPNKGSSVDLSQLTVLLSEGYPEPQDPLLSSCCFKHSSRVTLAQIEAADTIGYIESAFLATVNLIPGNLLDSFVGMKQAVQQYPHILQQH